MHTHDYGLLASVVKDVRDGRNGLASAKSKRSRGCSKTSCACSHAQSHPAPAWGDLQEPIFTAPTAKLSNAPAKIQSMSTRPLICHGHPSSPAEDAPVEFELRGRHEQPIVQESEHFLL